MPWKRMLAYVTGEIEESLLLRVEYLLEENRVLRSQIEKRILLTDAERRILSEKAVALGKLMADTVTIVKPEIRTGLSCFAVPGTVRAFLIAAGLEPPESASRDWKTRFLRPAGTAGHGGGPTPFSPRCRA